MFLGLVVYFASGAFAADFKTIKGEEYKDATVRRVEPDGVVLVTKWGISKLYFSELPQEVQKRFGYEAAQADASLTASPETGSERLQAAEQQHQTGIQQKAQPIPSRSPEIAPERTYEITRDYVIGGDTGGEVIMRLKRGERYRGRILIDGTEIDINGTSCTVPNDVLSASKD